tara:strand:- start:466 stop:858 length:393 start_codon:yes stop_codon:yes gene_type:complete
LLEPLLNLNNLSKTFNKDFEYSREIRYFSGLIKIEMDSIQQILNYENGTLLNITVKNIDDNQCKIIVKGDKDTWLNMLALKPIPFYQCMQSTAVKHNLYMNVSNETFAYLPALNRLMQIMRIEFNNRSSN